MVKESSRSAVISEETAEAFTAADAPATCGFECARRGEEEAIALPLVVSLSMIVSLNFVGLVSGKIQRKVRTASEERNVFHSRESAIDSAKRCVTARPRASSSLALSESWSLWQFFARAFAIGHSIVGNGYRSTRQRAFS